MRAKSIPAALDDISQHYLCTIVSLMFLSALTIVLVLLDPSVPIYPGLALVLIIAGALVFVNLNPLLKFDGYYAICDYFGFPNLRDRSSKLARAWLSQRLLGIELPTEDLPRRTRTLVIAYAIGSFVFTGWFIYVRIGRSMRGFGAAVERRQARPVAAAGEGTWSLTQPV